MFAALQPGKTTGFVRSEFLNKQISSRDKLHREDGIERSAANYSTDSSLVFLRPPDCSLRFFSDFS